MIKDRIIKWAIKQIVGDGTVSYGDMRYLEDVMTNDWGEKMFIFSHRLVPIDKAKMDAANAKLAAGQAKFSDVGMSQPTEQATQTEARA